MNPRIDSYLRHIFTAWITAAVLGLSAWLALDEKSAAALADGFSRIADGLLLVLAILVPAIGRLAWAWLAKIFRPGTGELDKTDDQGGPSGGAALLLFITCAAAALGGLPSCSSAGQTQDFETQDARAESAAWHEARPASRGPLVAAPDDAPAGRLI